MITVRPLRDDEVDVYVAVRTRVHPETPMPRDVVLDDRTNPDHLDLIAEVDGEPVGVASTAKFGGAPDGDLAFVTIRVPREHRRGGVGTALHRRASEHARTLGKSRFYAVVRHDDADSLAYYASYGYEEVGRMQDVVLDLSTTHATVHVPEGLAILPLVEEHEPGAYDVALEADADVPSGTQLRSGTFEQWRRRTLGPMAIRELSFVAIESGRVVGYAVMGAFTEDTAQHWMTGVARPVRGRGVATALKEAQIAAARQAGWKFLRTQNDLGNAPMRAVNEKLGYVRKFEWVHLAGPLLSG